VYSNFSSGINTGGLENEVQLLITAEVLEGAAQQLFFEISGLFLSIWCDFKVACQYNHLSTVKNMIFLL
jgi:hypothetical protein